MTLEYADRELLDYTIQYYKENGRPPTERDFTNNSKYPSCSTYRWRFGSLQKALKLVGLDVESMVKNGSIGTNDQKRRFSEIIIRDHFKQHPVDLAGENCTSPYDGLCPNGMTYDVKSSKFDKERERWRYGTGNKCKDEIEIYYLLGFNENYTELIFALRVPGEMIESDMFRIELNKRSRGFTVDSMKQYDITNRFREVLAKYEFFNKKECGQVRKGRHC